MNKEGDISQLTVRCEKIKHRKEADKLFQAVCDKNTDSALDWTDRIASFLRNIFMPYNVENKRTILHL